MNTETFTDNISTIQDGKIATFKLQGDGATITSGRIAAICFVAAVFMAINALLFFTGTGV